MMSSSNDDPRRSPTAVIDMRLLRLDEAKLIGNLDFLPLPSASASADADLATESSLPPLYSLSVCSHAANNDDSSSVSSVSLDDYTWDTAQVEKRCIFASYWKKKGGRPKPIAPSSPSSQDPEDYLKSDSLSCSEGDHSYEHLLQKNESPGVRRRSDASTSSSVRRRSLFSENHYVAQSVPSQLARYAVEPLMRKIQSTPVVGPRHSCLRKPRYSGCADTICRRSGEVTSTTTVSFSDDIQVKFLKPAAENWAPRGWSKHFV